MIRLDWDKQKILVAMMALSQLSVTTDTGEERTIIATMLYDLANSNRE